MNAALIFSLFNFPDSAAQIFPEEQNLIKAEATLDTNRILIGDQINFKLKAEYPSGKTLVWPFIGDTLINKVEVINRTKPDTLRQTGSKNISVSQSFTITSFDSGYFVIPPVRFSLSDNQTAFAETEPLLLSVQTVQVDTTLAIKDIKPPFGAPVTFKEMLPYILSAAGILIAIILLIIYFKRRGIKKPGITIIRKPKIPSHKIALDKLVELEKSKLWQKGEVKLYHSILTDIIRVYIEQRFSIMAMEMTSEDILAGFKRTAMNTELEKKLKQMLLLADLVKFAKANPPASEHELSLKNATGFVKETIPENNVGDQKKLTDVQL